MTATPTNAPPTASDRRQSTGRRVFMAAVLLLIAAFVVARVVAHYWPVPPQNAWSQVLGAKVIQGPGASIDFIDIAPVEWDRVHVFAPYTTDREIVSRLGFNWASKWQTSIGVNDGVMLVAFVRGNQMVGWFEHPRNQGDLAHLSKVRHGFAPDQARFRVEADHMNWISLKQQP